MNKILNFKSRQDQYYSTGWNNEHGFVVNHTEGEGQNKQTNKKRHFGPGCRFGISWSHIKIDDDGGKMMMMVIQKNMTFIEQLPCVRTWKYLIYFSH